MGTVIATGLGIATANSQSIEDFTHNLRQAKGAFASHRFSSIDNSIICARLHDAPDLSSYFEEPEFSEGNRRKLLHSLRRAPRALQWSTQVALDAWTDAGLDFQDGENTSLIIAGSNIDGSHYFDAFQKFSNTPEYLSPNFALTQYDSDHLGTISELLSIKGEGMTLGNASASGNAALLQAYRLIKNNYCQRCLVVAPFTDLSPVQIRAFAAINALGGSSFHHHPDEASRPFDQRSEGFIYGQACAAIVLENDIAASKRNASHHGTLLGGASLLHAHRSTEPNLQSETRVMERALINAKQSVADLDYINCHGTSTPLGDRTELEAIHQLLGQRANTVPINSTKGITGHCLNSTSIVEAIAIFIQMKHHFIHPNANLETPINNKLYLAPQNGIEPASIRVALSNAFAFGGINTALVLGAPRP